MQTLGEQRSTIACLLLIVATLAIYNPITRNQFINFDDNVYISENAHVRSGLTWDTVKWAFTTRDNSNWHPLTWLAHALDCQLFGLHPAGHHYVNVLLHTANAILLFVLLQMATGLTWPSLMVAALFALHPVNVESVAWAAERKNVLSMLFFLLALFAYDKYARRAGAWRYALVAIFFALGLMAKPQGITLPFVLLLWDFWPLQRMAAGVSDRTEASVTRTRSFPSLVFEKTPLFILAAVSAMVTIQAQHAGHAIRTVAEYNLPARLENALVSYARYVGHALLPLRLAPMYPHPGNSLPLWEVAGSTALLLAITLLVISARERRYLVVGWCWFLGTLVPMIGLVQVGEQGMADRYGYLALIGLFIMVVWTFDDIARERNYSSAWLTTLAAVVLLTLGAGTFRQIGYWRDSETLWRYTLGVTQNNFMAHDNLAMALAKQGKTEEAIAHFHAAEEIFSYEPSQILKLGLYEQNNGHPEGAIQQYKKVLQAATDSNLRSAALANLGLSYLQLGDSDQAQQSYEEAVHLDPHNAVAFIGLGVLAQRKGNLAEAVSRYSDAMKIQPRDVGFLLLASALRDAGRVTEADTAYEQARRLSEDLRPAQAAADQLLSHK
jgi:tetratricopeptide (TPR) repeat protein